MNLSIRNKLLAWLLISSGLPVWLFALVSFWLFEIQIKDRLADQGRRWTALSLSILEDQVAHLQTISNNLSQDDVFRTLFLLGLTSKFRAYLQTLKTRYGLSFCLVVDHQGLGPDWKASFMSFRVEAQHPFIQRALIGVPTAGYANISSRLLGQLDPSWRPDTSGSPGDESLLAMMFAAPLLDENGKFLGVLVGGRILDRDHSILQSVKKLGDGDWAIVANRRFISSSLMDPLGPIEYQSLFTDPDDQGLITVGLESYFVHQAVLADRLGPLSAKVLILSSDKSFRQIRSSLYSTATLFLIGGGILAIIMSFFFANRVVRPLKKLSTLTYRIAEGELDEQIPGGQRDEVGQLTDDFNRMVTKLAEKRKELAEANKRLLQLAHQGGMAELAASVLHNIGNAINWLTVATTTTRQNIPKDVVDSLKKTHYLLEDQRRWLTSGQVDQSFFAKILLYHENTILLLEEKIARLETDLTSLGRGADHIAEIIALQNKYVLPRGGDAFEDLPEVIDDALVLLADSLNKRGIDVRIEPADVPQVWINRNRMVQVLVNVIKNSLEAIDQAADLPEKTIRIAARLDRNRGDDFVCVAVIDSGIGLSPGEIPQVFRFGYSTKPSGSGIGLHDAANYIRSLGGSMAINSPGHGQGATVEIFIPVGKETKIE